MNWRVIEMKLKGKVAVVTGATSGIGAEIARVFGAEGAGVVVVGRNAERGNSVVKDIEEKNGKALFLQADMSEAADIDRMVNSAKEYFGKIDIIVNNAGLFLQSELEDLTIEQIDNTFATNERATMLIAKKAMPYLKETKGNIINTASMVGIRPAGPSYAYAASKAAIINLTKLLAKNYAPFQVRTNAICPGIIQTPIFGGKDMSGSSQMIPIGIVGVPQDIANLALFLASDDASFITGQIVVADGGQSL